VVIVVFTKNMTYKHPLVAAINICYSQTAEHTLESCYTHDVTTTPSQCILAVI